MCLSSGKSLGKEKTVKGASVSEDKVEPTEQALEEQVEEVRGDPPNF